MNPNFRRIEDAVRFVDELKKDIVDLSQLSVKQQSMLASLKSANPKIKELLASADEFDVTPNPRLVKKQMKTTIDPKIDKVVIPNLTKLKDQYGLLRDLYKKHSALEAAESQIALQFGDRKGPLYKQTMDSIAELKAKVAATMRSTFAFISDVAEKHVPKTFEKFTEAIRDKISDHVSFEDSQRYLYVSVNKDRKLVFTEYFVLIEAINDEGKMTPHLYVAIQWVVGVSAEVFVEHDFSLPDDLHTGTPVSTVQSAVEAVAHLLTLENFSSAIGNIPMSISLKNPNLQPENFQARDVISSIAVEPEKLIFKFKRGVSKEQRSAAARSIFIDLKQHLKIKKAKIQVEIFPTQAVFTLHNIAEEKEISNHDVMFFKDKFGLSDLGLKKIQQVIQSDGE